MFTVSEENYIKSIYHLQKHARNVSTNELAERLQTKPASVTDMLKKLKAKNLLDYEKYYGVTLTPEGKKLALEVIRRHRLWENFLVNHLQFGWDEVHEIAEQLEHVQSVLLTDKLDAFMNFPRFDPHGDPIPDSKGKMQQLQQINLMQLPLGQLAEICAVGSQQSELLEMLRSKNLQIGSTVTITQRYNFDHSIEVEINKQPPQSLSEQLAKQLFVKVK
jgi:DtxR family transcriptional regulator, Mn-dependent transcriptional regulator